MPRETVGPADSRAYKGEKTGRNSTFQFTEKPDFCWKRVSTRTPKSGSDSLMDSAGAARKLLMVVEKNPQAVLEAV